MFILEHREKQLTIKQRQKILEQKSLKLQRQEQEENEIKPKVISLKITIELINVQLGS
jgi:hypothetical protein